MSQVERVATETVCTPGQLALAWLTAQGPDIVPTSGTRRRRWLEENAGAMDLTRKDRAAA